MNQTTSEAAELLGGGGGQLDLKNAAAETPLNALAEAPSRFPPWLAPVKASSPIQLLHFHGFSREKAQRRDPETFPSRLLSEAECKKADGGRGSLDIVRRQRRAFRSERSLSCCSPH